jgi:hypothetical protein
VSYNVKQNSKKKKKSSQKVVKKLSKKCQKVVNVIKTFDPAKQKKSQKVDKKWSKYWQHRPKSSVSKTATMSAPPKNVTFVTFLQHKKELKSFLQSLTICDKVASGNKKMKKINGKY